MDDATRQQPLAFYLSAEHPCSYLPERMARTVFLDPHAAPRREVYQKLAARGFRRSGPLLYRPECAHCSACVPVRIPVAAFRPDRSQRRIRHRNRDLTVRMLPPRFNAEHFGLYHRYLEIRHPDGGMDQHSEMDYAGFLVSRWSESVFVEMRLAGRLAAVAVVDVFTDALSAVYTFYDPRLARRSLGTFAILWEIDEARRRGSRWLYLGYWIAASPKMAYKDRFRPCERLGPEGWEPLP